MIFLLFLNKFNDLLFISLNLESTNEMLINSNSNLALLNIKKRSIPSNIVNNAANINTNFMEETEKGLINSKIKNKLLLLISFKEE